MCGSAAEVNSPVHSCFHNKGFILCEENNVFVSDFRWVLRDVLYPGTFLWVQIQVWQAPRHCCYRCLLLSVP